MVTKSLVSFMLNLGYELNATETKVGGNWWKVGSIFYNEVTGDWKTTNLASAMMLEASLKD